jgi:hypothetical protein
MDLDESGVCREVLEAWLERATTVATVEGLFRGRR